MNPSRHKSGFTLIEISIVLIIIGLIVGGVLVGRDLIKASEIRSQLTQIESIKTSATAFRLKYGYLPGDITQKDASDFGFVARGDDSPGRGDGNGLLECRGISESLSGACISGETALFWVDLTTAKLISGRFTAADCCTQQYLYCENDISTVLPKAKIGAASNCGAPYLYVWSKNGINYLGLTTIAQIEESTIYPSPYYTALTTVQAYALDSKVDDGLAMSGIMKAIVIADPLNTSSEIVSFGRSSVISIPASSVYMGATTPTSFSCFDNGASAGAPMKYTTISSNSGANCSVSIELK